MAHEAWFFVGIFVFIFLIWVVTGGPMHPLAFAGPTLAEPQELGGGSYLQFPRAAYSIGSTHTILPGSGDQEIPRSVGTTGRSGGSGTGSDNTTGVPGTVFGLASPYQNLVTMNHYVGNASSSDPKSEYVEISVAQNASTAINITGWILRSDATSIAEIIPRGTKVPTSGAVNASSDIILQPGERAIIISGESPVGASFEENKCTGYFGAFQRFNPSLPQNCPTPSTELSDFYGTPYIHDPNCIDYMDTIPRCSVPITRVNTLSNTCQDFLEAHFNYNGCVRFHGSDSDFGGNTWHIYLGRKTHMWRARHEVVKLLDSRGKTVAVFGY